MILALFFEPMLNGVQFGLMRFLLSAGLTLVFGVMGLINLARGSLHMIGAFFCAAATAATGNLWQGLTAGMAAAAAAGALIEIAALRRAYNRDHLDQVPAPWR